MVRNLARVALALVAVAGVAIATASPASTHTMLESTEPRSGDVLDAPPAHIVLRFSQSVDADADAIRLLDADGTTVTVGAVGRPDDRTVAVDLDDLPPGGYIVAWRVVSGDGHPLRGTFTWRLGASAPEVDPAVIEQVADEQEPSRSAEALYAVARFLAFAGVIVLVGAGAFVASHWPTGGASGATRWVLWNAWGAAVAGTVVGLVSQWSELGGTDSRWGQVWIGRLALLAVAAVLLARLQPASTWWRVVGAVAGIALVATPALSGHAETGRWAPWSQVADVLHVGAAAVWLGGLAVLLTAALRSEEAREVTLRFSKVAFTAIAVVVLTGSFQSIRQVTSLDELESGYGRLLAIKVVVVLLLIGVASLSRSVLHGRMPVQGDSTLALRRLVGAEVVIGVVVIAVTALLVDANPSRASGGGEPFAGSRVVDDVLINLNVVPGTVGPTDIHLFAEAPGGGLEPPRAVRGELTLASGGTDAIPVPFLAAGPGHWSAYDVDVPRAGDWELHLEITVTDSQTVDTSFTVPIGGSS